MEEDNQKPNAGGSTKLADSTDISMISSYQPQNNQRYGDQDDEEGKKNLWRNLLQSVGQRTESRPAHILLLGDRNAGKRSLLKAMNKPFMKSMGIQVQFFDDIGSEYSLFESSFLYARDIHDIGGDENQQIGMEENLTHINVWVISEEQMCDMIPKVLTAEDLEYTFAMIVPDLDQPWDLISQCARWMNALKDALFKISPKLKLKTLENLKERIEELYKTYQEPELDKDGKLINKKIRKLKKNTETPAAKDDGDDLNIDQGFYDEQEVMDELRKEIDLPEGILVTNIFVPSAIVCSKVDLIEHGEPQIKQTLEQNIDFIQYSLRKFCLQYGSSLIFTSANSGSNIQVLYDYIIYRLYDTDFTHTSKVDDKEALFVPTGFDSPDMISQMDLKKVKSMKNTEDMDEIAYNDIIKEPGKKQQQMQEERKEVECPDWKKTLEAAYEEKVNKQEHKDKFMAKMKGGTDAMAQLQNIRNRNAAPAGAKPGAVGKPTDTRASAGGAPPKDKQPPVPNGGQTASGGAAGEDASQEQKKKAKVKDFYSNLLNKKKTDKLSTPKGSSGGGGGDAPSANPKES